MTAPQRIGRYRILDVLGQGAMGVVYRGRDEGLDRDAAVKVIRGESLDDESRGQFQKEARAAARLQHPHIVTIYEMGEEGEMPFMAMELLDGQDLQRSMRDGTLSDPLAALAVAEQVLSGLGHAHARGIVHRDMKPSNVFLHGGASVKVLDFGVARLGEGMTMTGRIVGTPHYMSPEQVRADHVDGRTDLFSTALMFYEMVTGAKAYRPGSAVSVMFQIVHEDADLSRLPPTPRGEAVRRVLRRALARDRNQRYPDAGALGAALADAVRSYEGATAFEPEPAIGGATMIESALPELEVAEPAAQPVPPVPPARAAAPLPRPVEDVPELELTATYDEPATEPEWELPPPQLAVATREALPGNPAPPSRVTVAAAAFVATVLTGLTLTAAGIWWWTSRPARAVDGRATPATVVSEPTQAVSVPAATAPRTTVAQAPAAPSVAPSLAASAATAPAETAPPTVRAAAVPPAASTGPVDVRSRLDRADALFQSGHLGAALAEARAVLRQEPANEEAQYLVDDIVLDLAVEKHFKDARAALARGDRTAARREVDEGLALKPNESRLTALLRELDR
jgi:tRNA A-37 threonylcarbamoyl transferase component Bud32